eukprot:9424076-Pyramimonas_sp.AAC.1
MVGSGGKLDLNVSMFVASQKLVSDLVDSSRLLLRVCRGRDEDLVRSWGFLDPRRNPEAILDLFG